MGKSNWEKLIDLPQEYDVNPNLAKNAIAQIQAEQQKPRVSWWVRYRKKLACVLGACVLIVAAFIPVYRFLSTPEIVYYADEKVTVENVDNVSSLLAEKNVSVCYFDTPMANTRYGVIADTGEFAYLWQNMLYVDGSYFDQIYVYAVVMKNATFEFEKDYDKCSSETIYQEQSVFYTTIADENKSSVLAKFTADGVKYYLEIQTSGDAETKVLQYVAMLLQK